jgi:hypothetical protein
MATKNPRRDRDWREPIRRSEVATDFGITLARIQWDFFATPTFAGTVPKPQIAYGLAFRWLQELALVCGRPYNRLLIALRGEEGEEKGRFHFHCLVGGTATRNYHTLLHQAEWLWKRQSGGARVDVRQYDRSLAGADYVCKCLGANAYELSKYSFANSVTLSASVIRLIAGIDASGERRGGDGHMKKQDGARAVGEGAGRDALCDETSSLNAGSPASATA